ncbi:MAG TPA: DUF3500 domain-containing protein [Natronosporangium sp.]
MPNQMTAAAQALLDRLDDQARELGHRPLHDERLRWLDYRPVARPGVSLTDLDPAARKAAHRLLATGLSSHAYAQAMAIVALEEVLDRKEGWRRGRHSNDYWVVVYGNPGDDAWAWRFEGHHLSVTMTVIDGQVHPTPVFLGANPAAVRYAGQPVLRPLAIEEDLARGLLAAIGPAGRAAAIVADFAPADIHSGVSPRAADQIPPLGVRADALNPDARELLNRLVRLYLDRLPEPLAAAEASRLDLRDLHFAWEGSTEPGHGHYYRIQGGNLLIEYDNTANQANHAHTVLRRPRSDFGGDALAAHLAEVRHRA